MKSLEVLLLNAKDIPILVEREFTVECCVRGHHVYQKEWEADTEVGHIPKFLSKITYFTLNMVEIFWWK